MVAGSLPPLAQSAPSVAASRCGPGSKMARAVVWRCVGVHANRMCVAVVLAAYLQDCANVLVLAGQQLLACS